MNRAFRICEPSACGAGDAGGQRRIKSQSARRADRFTAGLAITEVPLCDPLKGRSDARALLATSPGLGARHGLLLQRVYPAKATDRLLVQHDGCLTLPAQVLLLIQFSK